MAHHAGLYRRRQYWYFKYKDDNGKWIERATRTVDRKKALSIKSQFLRELEAGQLPNDSSQWSLCKAAELWLLDRKLRVARSSYLSEKAIVRALAGCGKTQMEPENSLVSTERTDKKKACAEETSSSWTRSATSARSSEFRRTIRCVRCGS